MVVLRFFIVPQIFYENIEIFYEIKKIKIYKTNKMIYKKNNKNTKFYDKYILYEKIISKGEYDNIYIIKFFKMKIENTIKLFKEIHPETLILIKVGSFYHAYGKDSYILSYLFNYQIKKVQVNYSTCGFPLAGKARVITKIEELMISYLIVNKAENYEISEEEDFKSKNQYTEIFNKAHKYLTKKIELIIFISFY